MLSNDAKWIRFLVLVFTGKINTCFLEKIWILIDLCVCCFFCLLFSIITCLISCLRDPFVVFQSRGCINVVFSSTNSKYCYLVQLLFKLLTKKMNRPILTLLVRWSSFEFFKFWSTKHDLLCISFPISAWFRRYLSGESVWAGSEHCF